MKRSRLFPTAMISCLILVMFGVSHLSAAVTSRYDFFSDNSYISLIHNTKAPATYLANNIFEIPQSTDSVLLDWNPVEIDELNLFPNIHISKSSDTITNVLLTHQISTRILNINEPSEPAEDTIFNDADDVKFLRTPTPGSLLLVVLGLLSLRYTRQLRY